MPRILGKLLPKDPTARRTRAGTSVRTRLVGLSLAVLIPSVLIAFAGSYYIYREQEAGYQQSVRETVHALALVVDKELARREEVLRALAASPALDRGDLKTFYETARRLAPRWDSVIVLADTS